MADPRTSFVTLEDVTTQVGVPLHRVVEGDAAAGKNAHAAIVAKDAAGNLIYLKTGVGGALLTTDDAATVCKRSQAGELAAGSATMVLVTGAVIPLAVSKEYASVGFVVSCRRDALFQIIWSDNGVESVLAEIIVGSGAYTISDELHCLSFTSGATGTQELLVKAKNFEALSSLRASIVAEEVQG